jgi:hypothetical protein
MEAVPEISKMVTPFKSIRIPRENELGFAYANASFRIEWLVTARFLIGACEMVSRISANALMVVIPFIT